MPEPKDFDMTTDYQISFLMEVRPSNWLNFASGLRINMDNGTVEIPADLTLDEASREFWEGLGAAFPRRAVGFGDYP